MGVDVGVLKGLLKGLRNGLLERLRNGLLERLRNGLLKRLWKSLWKRTVLDPVSIITVDMNLDFLGLLHWYYPDYHRRARFGFVLVGIVVHPLLLRLLLRALLEAVLPN